MTLTRTLNRILLLFFAFVIVALLAVQGTLMFAKRPQVTVHGQAIDQVRELHALSVLECEIVSDFETQFENRKATWIAHGKAQYVVRFDQVEVESVDELTRTVTLTLPRPQPAQLLPDWERSRMLAYGKEGIAWWTMGAFGGSYKEFEARSKEQLRIRLEEAAGKEWLLLAAKRSGESFVGAIYGTVGWKPVVRWRE